MASHEGHSHRAWTRSVPTGAAEGDNPLRRGVDRTQTWAGRALAVLAILLLPLAALAAGTATHQASMHTVRVQAATRHHAVATTTAAAPRTFDAIRVHVPVRVAGTPQPAPPATALVAPGTPAGAPVAVWVDNRSGRVVPPPKSPSASTHEAVWAATGAAVAAGGLVWLLWLVVRRVAGWWRVARWQAEWRRVEPRWSARFDRGP
ncbi:hypothetical protein [Streptomyces sp. HPF1205]|uniref:Rv1733c family protein n=1 Tax=Streptomyces sp. HPF1205 TaxID=2873262 RepID=UPI001CED2A2A|nr:hypothetical protein [Streptomyces sp. HPF1205]